MLTTTNSPGVWATTIIVQEDTDIHDLGELGGAFVGAIVIPIVYATVSSRTWNPYIDTK